MSHEEKGVWVAGALAVGTYAVYLSILFAEAGGRAVVETPYVGPMLWAIGISIGASIVVSILIAVFSPKNADKKDQRDRQIYRRGEYAGHWILVVGALAAMVMAMAQWNHFWIANAIYLAFVLSAILGSIVKIVAYRRGMQAW